MPRLPCPDELWSEFSALLDHALDLPTAKRAEWLASLAVKHAAVLPWLTKVVAVDGNIDTGFMRFLNPSDSDFVAEQLIGPYRLERSLGTGGMGEVWLATRDDGALSRRVALKLPHRNLFADVARRRFERERDILAALSHPHIAVLYDAGVDDLEHPYLAMEWVDGVSLTEYCTKNGLGFLERVALFLQILDAVQYAHARLVAHRDLKPSNILVTAAGHAKLLDFGIAKLLDTALDGATELTQAGTRLATPEYAAPEQLTGEPLTVAVDVFALGVIFYELLTGRRPFPRRGGNVQHSSGRASTNIRPDHAANVGHWSLRQLRRALRGDLDSILAKALEPKPADRYLSTQSFAADIQNSLAHRPISARRIGAGLLAARFVRRHWLGVSMSAALVLALVGGSAGIVWQALRVEREAKRALTIKNFLLDMFRASDPRIAADKPRGQITARELLDASAARIESSFASEPATEIELLSVAADIYRELDETGRSTALYSRESTLARHYYGAADLHTVDGMLGEAWNANVDADYPRALSLLAQADPLLHAAGLDESAARARWLMVKGEALATDANKREEADQVLAAAAALFARAAPDHALYPDVLIDLGAMALEDFKFTAAAEYYRRAIRVSALSSQSGSKLLLADAGLALALKDQGDFLGAHLAFAAGAAAAERSYGRDSRSYWAIASDWARFRYERGEREPALAAFAALMVELPPSRDKYRSASDALEGSQVLRKFGRCLATDGQGAKAIELLLTAQDLARTAALHSIDGVRLTFDLAKAYEAGGRPEDAANAYREVLDQFRMQGSALQRAIAEERFGRFLLRQNELDAAHSQFNTVLRASDASTEPALYARAGLAAIAIRRGDAKTAMDESERALAALQSLQGFYDVRIEPYVWIVRARALKLRGDQHGAREFAARALHAIRQYFDAESPEWRGADALSRELTPATP